MRMKPFIAAILATQAIISAAVPAQAKPIVYTRANEKAHEAAMSYIESQEEGLTVREICFRAGEEYDLNPYLLLAIAERESQFDENAENSGCIGIMQVSERWHKDRMERLGVKDLKDAYGNIFVATDYIAELIDEYDDVRLALMVYNMRRDTALRLYKQGKYSKYAKGICKRAEELMEECGTE